MAGATDLGFGVRRVVAPEKDKTPSSKGQDPFEKSRWSGRLVLVPPQLVLVLVHFTLTL